MTLVTLSASYGAGGSRIGPALAQRLDVPFIDRAIPVAVAERLAVPLDDALARDQSVSGTLERLLASFAPLSDLYGGSGPPAEVVEDRSYAEATEQVIRERAAAGDGVILGRAGARILRDEPGVLRVRLDGPVDARIAQAMQESGIDHDTAASRLERTDRARDAYIHHFHGVDVHDAALYHLVIDSTAIPLDACVALIATAAQAL